MGHSGSGKSTLLNLMGGLDRPSAGTIQVGGVDLASLDENGLARFRREWIGIIFQQHHLVPYLTALENVMMAQYFHSVTDEAEARAALERVGLGNRLRNRPGELSGGEQQRVCIARSIINSPRILLGDEPTGNLDHQNTRMVLELLRELRDQEKFTIVLVTHNSEVAAWGDRTIFMDDGVVVRDEQRGAPA
jgi:putative ABC transport system ATP-binding protein